VLNDGGVHAHIINGKQDCENCEFNLVLSPDDRFALEFYHEVNNQFVYDFPGVSSMLLRDIFGPRLEMTEDEAVGFWNKLKTIHKVLTEKAKESGK